jgi:hypothetical protein
MRIIARSFQRLFFGSKTLPRNPLASPIQARRERRVELVLLGGRNAFEGLRLGNEANDSHVPPLF